MPKCQCCGRPVVGGLVLHSECYEKLLAKDATVTLFDQVTTDPSTLAANMVKNAHDSIIAWAAMHGIKAEFTTSDFLHDVSRMEAALRREAAPVALLMVSGKELRDG